MASYDSLLGVVGEHVEGCPAPTIISHVRRATVRACEETLLWRHEEKPYALSPGIPEYSYQKPKNTEIHAIFLASVNGVPLERMTLDEATAKYPAWVEPFGGMSPQEIWANTQSGSINNYVFNDSVYNENPEFVSPESMFACGGTPMIFTQVSTDKFFVLPYPDDDETYNLKLIYALKPTRTSTEIPDWVFNELEDTIIHQAVHTLLMLPDNPWTDTSLSAFHGRKARYHMSERRARANLGNARGSLTVKFNRWA